MKLGSVTERDFSSVNPDMTLRELIKVISASKRNLFPVINEENELQGIIMLDDIREIMFDTDAYDKIYVHNLMALPPAVILYDEKMSNVVKKFNETGAWNLPVIKNNKYNGFVSKSKMFEVYRKHLIEISDD